MEYVKQYSDTVRVNRIISIDPSSGLIKTGDKITVVYSIGPEFVTVPNVVGLTRGQASQQLKKNADAIKYFEQYLEAAPNAKNANAITFTLGALYQGANNKTKALENYKKVVNDPKWGVQAKQMIDALSK